MDPTIFSVSEVNRAVKQFLEGTSTFKNMYIQGELSNITYYRSGHLYFTLKDDKASVKCAIFKYLYKNVPTDLKEGDHVKIMGNATIYEANGSFQIIAETLEKSNKAGSLYEKMEMLKKFYFEKGYFDDSNKKPLPLLPLNIGVVTAETGAAIKDIINTVHKRFKNINIYLYPSKVQGEGASAEIASGIEFFNKMKDNGQLDTDVIIIGRGGGSIEDLWAFNEEPVIEAVYTSEIPVISAVGHEIDNLLSDLVADRRAATPTQAAEILIPVKEEFINGLKIKKNTLNKFLLNKISFVKKELEHRKNNYYIKNYISILNDKKLQLIEKERKISRELRRITEKSREQFNYRKNRFEKINLKFIIEQKKLYIEALEDKLNTAIQRKIKNLKDGLQYKNAKLSGYSVNDILKQGYTITRKNGKVIKRGIELSKSDNIEIQFSDIKVKSIIK
ncbi:exodeoxyribonuclease VII large subunit [Leptotrichia sp. OH3620_COT-345]|uniref:exodeoxyribonuclease VII large subunit n=1 Tax=Leptotrichia sp. OH3620_COT-345 TaxID=2491048 RepID=UPI000F65258A|nr:exodeoxyribonuclease VII large subunit [Leptotrichia sp. OH3620_COT-345]RRD40444.1 exodeoxyribonuclease VII large subunit [Leptotrichia sp. OH3620_COT-345]